MKLSKKQREVIQKMRDGWELGCNINSWFTLKKTDAFGVWTHPHQSTILSLIDRGIIIKDSTLLRFYLTELGKSITL